MFFKPLIELFFFYTEDLLICVSSFEPLIFALVIAVAFMLNKYASCMWREGKPYY